MAALSLQPGKESPQKPSMPAPPPMAPPAPVAAPPPVPKKNYTGTPARGPAGDGPKTWGKLWRISLLGAWATGLVAYALTKNLVVGLSGGASALVNNLISCGLLLLLVLLWKTNKSLCIILSLITLLVMPLMALPALILLGLATLLGIRKLFPLYLVLLVLATAALPFVLPEKAPMQTFMEEQSQEGKALSELLLQIQQTTGVSLLPDGVEALPAEKASFEGVHLVNETVLPKDSRSTMDWEKARSLVPISGIMEIGGKHVVLVGTEIKEQGDQVEVTLKRKTYTFLIKEVNLDRVELEPVP